MYVCMYECMYIHTNIIMYVCMYSTSQMQLKPHSRATRTAHASAIKSTRECTKHTRE